MSPDDLQRYEELLAENRALRGRLEGAPGGRPRGRGKRPWPLTVYLAGKIRKNCWRHELVAGLREATSESSSCPSGDPVSLPDEWPVLHRAVLGEHHYAGPYFQSCDHGCFHGPDSHGTAATEPDP